jgi:aspartyl/asparaginyl beta-hydroxylase (cupin superfamily)
MNYKTFIVIMFIVSIIMYYHVQYDVYDSINLINNLLTHYCEDQSVFNPKDFAWTKNFRSNWKNIRDEYLQYTKNNTVPLFKNINTVVARPDIHSKWKTLFLRAYGKNTNVCKHFPLTLKLINSCPCTLAYFSILEPGAQLEPHVGVYKGVIRYHLGLIIPEDWENCFLEVDNKKLYWHEGSDLMFDDMYEHYAQNNTDQPRIILFLDIQRDFKNVFINNLNKLFLKYIKSNDVLTETIDNINKYSK